VEKKKAMAARPFFPPLSGYRLTLFNKFFPVRKMSSEHLPGAGGPFRRRILTGE
jgi:hypothetical protein